MKLLRINTFYFNNSNLLCHYLSNFYWFCSSKIIKLQPKSLLIHLLITYLPWEPAMLSRRKSSGDPLETPPGGLQIFWLNHWQIQTKWKRKKILSGFASDLAKISGDPPRTISAGTTLMVHMVVLNLFTIYRLFWPLYSKLKTQENTITGILIAKLFFRHRTQKWVTNPNHYWIPHQAFSSLLNKKKQTIERDEKNTSMTTHSFLIFTKGVATKTVWATPISLPP